jgi:hypothetical protein
VTAAMAEDILHAILQEQLALLQGDFLEVFGFGKVWLGGQFPQAAFELVVLRGEIAEFRVGPQQQFPRVL